MKQPFIFRFLTDVRQKFTPLTIDVLHYALLS
jgi:hypothetical protein